MKIAILTEDWRYTALEQMASQLSKEPLSCVHYATYDDFIAGLPQSRCDLSIIAQNGAGGMESVRAAKTLLPEKPVIWFSDDKGFGPESYRLGCAYFSAAPITPELLQSAIIRCTSDTVSYF